VTELAFAGGSFSTLHREVVGPPLDLGGLRPEHLPPELLEIARATWRERAMSEFRSIQIMSRFLSELVGAGDPLDVYAGAVDLVVDEIRHAEMCAAVCQALGAPALLPDPVALVDAPGFLNAPMAERALATAITMVGINETISAGYIADLSDRCRRPAIKQVLDRTIGDEHQHQEFGWNYIRRSLGKFPSSTLSDWRHLVQTTLAPHQRLANQALGGLPPERIELDQWPEQDLADAGLFSAQRQALVFRRTWSQCLEPKLEELGLLRSA